eukprot:gb/GECH01008583.1/.p1 GENE.gb/GECH01008583.1/~~gb/GECH01008583.1/.p1  ORF type:complete len:148 (+),score=27.08 gb/GECH01008583.1/:1-444(+)
MYITMNDIDAVFNFPLRNAYFQADINPRTRGWVNPNKAIPLTTHTNLNDLSVIDVTLEPFSAGNPIPVTLNNDGTIQLLPGKNLETVIGESFRTVVSSSNYDTSSSEAEFTVSSPEGFMSSMSGDLQLKANVSLLFLIAVVCFIVLI